MSRFYLPSCLEILRYPDRNDIKNKVSIKSKVQWSPLVPRVPGRARVEAQICLCLLSGLVRPACQSGLEVWFGQGLQGSKKKPGHHQQGSHQASLLIKTVPSQSHLTKKLSHLLQKPQKLLWFHWENINEVKSYSWPQLPAQRFQNKDEFTKSPTSWPFLPGISLSSLFLATGEWGADREASLQPSLTLSARRDTGYL